MGRRKFYYGDRVKFVSPIAYARHQSHQGTVVGTLITKKHYKQRTIRTSVVRYQVRCECGADVIPQAPALDLIDSSPGEASNVDKKIAEARVSYFIGLLGHDEQITPETLDEMMSKLEDRQREIIVMRYGLNGSYRKTLKQIGDTQGVTRERIRQIEVKAIRLLSEN